MRKSMRYKDGRNVELNLSNDFVRMFLKYETITFVVVKHFSLHASE
jgi:hypothetical protein